MKIQFYLLLASILTLIPYGSYSQHPLKKVSINGSIGTIISTDSTTPFLLRSNQYGVVPSKSGIGYLNISLNQGYDSLFTLNKKLKRFGYAYGLEVHTNIGKSNELLLPVAFTKIRYGAFELYGGRRREIQGLVDSLGTIGSYSWSGNALPMPKIEISIPEYTPIIRNGLLAIKGNFAHGWFGKGDSVQNVFLHQKSFYARLGKQNWKINLFGGFNHQVQWGGYPTKPFYDDLSSQFVTRYSTDYSTFVKVVTGISLNNKGQGLNSGAPTNEALNRAGNHLGSVDIGFQYKFALSTIFIYRQSFYDDGSLFYLNNIKDGLTGFSAIFRNKAIKRICLEYLDTRSQGGNFFTWTPELRGLDDYFNNSIYLDSWTYKRNTIGNPMLTASNINLNGAEKSNQNVYIYKIINNRLWAVNCSLFYELLGVNNISKLTISKNLGSYSIMFERSQLSYFHNIEKDFKNFKVSLDIVGDVGKLWNNNLGLRLEISKSLK